MEALADEVVLAVIALSCHFALDILCDKSETRKCIDMATFDLSQEGTDVTSDDRCKCDMRCRRHGQCQHLKLRPGSRRLRVPNWESLKLFSRFVCSGRFPKRCEP